MTTVAGALEELTPYLPGLRELIKEERRTLVWAERLSDGRRVVVKLYRHLGLWNMLRGLVTGFRSEREFQRLSHLVRNRIPCTRPVAWSRGYFRDHGFFSVLVTEEIPAATSLDIYLVEHEVPVRSLARLFRDVRLLHEAGFCHQTLFSSNILVSTQHGQPVTLISDVPRSWVFPSSIVGTKMAIEDLADLVRCVLASGLEPERIPLAEYGLTESEIDRFWQGFERRRIAKARRRLRDCECRVRLFWAICMDGLRQAALSLARRGDAALAGLWRGAATKSAAKSAGEGGNELTARDTRHRPSK